MPTLTNVCKTTSKRWKPSQVGRHLDNCGQATHSSSSMQTGQAFRCRSLAHGPALCAWRSRTRVAAQAARSNKFVWVEPLSKVKSSTQLSQAARCSQHQRASAVHGLHCRPCGMALPCSARPAMSTPAARGFKSPTTQPVIPHRTATGSPDSWAGERRVHLPVPWR